MASRRKQNVTLTLDGDLLTEARVMAARRGISVSMLLAEYLEQVVKSTQAYESARQQAMARLKKPFAGPGARTWTRDELYEERTGLH